MNLRLLAEYKRRCSESSDIGQHMPVLYETARRYPKAHVIELGVRFGYSTAALLAGADSVDGHVWSIDVAVPSVPDLYMESGRWSFHHGDDLSALSDRWAPSDCDVLFIDTSHTFEQTLEELRLYFPRVKPGGIALLHDTEYDAEHDYPVARALNKFARDWRNIPGSFGLGILERAA